MKNKLIFVAIFVIAGLFSLISFNYFVTRAETKFINIINFNNYPIILNYKDKNFTIGVFDTKTIYLDSRDSFTAEVKKENGDVLKKISVEDFKQQGEYLGYVFAQSNYCFYLGKLENNIYSVTDKYGFKDNEIRYKLDPSKFYTFLGLDVNKIQPSFTTIYPAKCDSINDSEKLKSLTKLYLNYNSADQVKKLEEEIKKVNSETDINQL